MTFPNVVATEATQARSARPLAAYVSLACLAVIIVLGALLRFHTIGQKNIWVDEGVSIALARLDWYNFLRILWRHEANMTLYYLFLRPWLLFGSSEAYIRSLSAVFGLATIPAVFVLGRRMFDGRAGLIASFLLALNAYAVRYSQEARSYSLFPLLCVISSIYFVKFLQEPGRQNRMWYVAFSVLAVYAHFFAGLLVVAQWLSFRLLVPRKERDLRAVGGLVRDAETADSSHAPTAQAQLRAARNDKMIGRCATAEVVPSPGTQASGMLKKTAPEFLLLQEDLKKAWRQFGIAVAPLAIFIVSTGVGVLRWVPRPNLAALHNCFLFLTGNGGTPLLVLYLAVIVAGTVMACRAGMSRPVSFAAWRYIFLLTWFLFPILFVFLMSQLKPLFVIRYFVFTIPAVVLLAAAGLAQIRQRVLLAILLVIFGFFSLRGVESFYQQDFDITREDWRSASGYVLANSEPGDVILFHQPITRMPYEYYRGVTPANNPPTVIYPEHGQKLMFRDFYAGRAPDAFLAGLAERYPRLWIALSYNQLPSGPDPTTQFLTDVFGKQYRQMSVRKFPGIEVRLYSR